MEKYLSQLNDAQLAPTLQIDGPMIIIAGAGSGKTRVLTYRIAYLMSKGIDSFNILALTFTNKAANEMKGRIADIVGDGEAKNLWMGTFHSVFAKILRFEGHHLGFPSNFTIYDTQDSQKLMGSIIKEMGLDKDIYKTKQVYSRISSYKNSLVTVKAYFKNPELMEADAMARRPKMGEIYKEYVDRCFKAGAMDFDDLLLRTNELLTRFPNVLAQYQDKFRYILVDEYQDTNHSQYLIVRALADRFQNICVVGDDAQSIYAFRGANINNIMNFQKDYDGVMMYRLEQNYRSTKNIVGAANSVIEHNKTKIDKIVWTANNEGEKVIVHRAMTDAEEGRYVGLSFYQRKEIKDVTAYLRLILNSADEEALKRVINYPARGIGQTTIDRLVVAANATGRTIYDLIKNIDSVSININNGTKNKLRDFITLIESYKVMNQTANAFDLSEHVTKTSGLIRELSKDGTPEGITKIDNVQELLNGIKDFVEGQMELADAGDSLAEFLEDVALATDLDADKGDPDHVALMSIHMAKGLEFGHVFIVGMEEDLFPSAMSMNTRSELEEERRLFYVALTRAEKQAYLTYTLSRYRWGKLIDAEPSRFIEEIDEEFINIVTPLKEQRFNPMLDKSIFGDIEPNRIRFAKPKTAKMAKKKTKTKPENFEISAPKKMVPLSEAESDIDSFDKKLEVGSKVNHQRFGRGEVLKIEGVGADAKAEIKFQKGDTKKLLLRFAKLQIMRE